MGNITVYVKHAFSSTTSNQFRMMSLAHALCFLDMHIAGIILCSQLANLTQLYPNFDIPRDQCKSGEKRFSLYALGF